MGSKISIDGDISDKNICNFFYFRTGEQKEHQSIA